MIKVWFIDGYIELQEANSYSIDDNGKAIFWRGKPKKLYDINETDIIDIVDKNSIKNIEVVK